MPSVAKLFPTYSEIPTKIPQPVWITLRLVTLSITLWLIYFLATNPAIGLRLIWGLLIPLLPLSFVVIPGLWRQICPMAFLNQIPRTLGFSLNYTLPVRWKNLSFYVSAAAFFIIVSFRHISLNQNSDVLAYVLVAALVCSFAGGVVFKGRSGWCGTFCPLAPIQRTYGQAPVVLVGKGITFDTGGISIKPADGMEKMKYDMAGGATMIGAMRAIAMLKPKVKVTAIICATENMPSGKAQKPGDVQIAMSGKSIEIINTDAEGRLVLADGSQLAVNLDSARGRAVETHSRGLEPGLHLCRPPGDERQLRG